MFNPVEALPGVVQPISRALPTTHAFTAARSVLDGEPPALGTSWWSGAIGAVVLMALAFAFVVAHAARVPPQGAGHPLLLSEAVATATPMRRPMSWWPGTAGQSAVAGSV